MSYNSILEVHQLVKSYGPVKALKGVSFAVPPGSVFGILGPNGSGKTTLLGIILDVLKADSGTYNWMDGMDAASARSRIGSLLETPNFYHYLSAMDNLDIAAAIKRRGADDKLNVLQTVGLAERKDSKFQTYSLGMKQRLAIGSALLGRPDVLILDEPTNGLDPSGIAEIRELILQLNSQGITIIMASHLLSEVEKVCSHIAILKQGTLIASGAINDVLRNEDQIEIAARDMDRLRTLLTAMPEVQNVTFNDGCLLVSGQEGLSPEHLNAYCQANQVVLSHLRLRKKGLETRFMELTNTQQR